MTDSLTIINDGAKLVEDAIYAGMRLSHRASGARYVCARLALALIRNRWFNGAGAVMREMERLIPVLVSLNAFSQDELVSVAELQQIMADEWPVVAQFVRHAMEWNRETSRDFAEFQCGCTINWNEVQPNPAPTL